MNFSIKESKALGAREKKKKENVLIQQTEEYPTVKTKTKSIHAEKLRKEGEVVKRSPKDNLNYHRYIISIVKDLINDKGIITIYDKFLGREHGKHTLKLSNGRLEERVEEWVKHFGAKTHSVVKKPTIIFPDTEGTYFVTLEGKPISD